MPPPIPTMEPIIPAQNEIKKPNRISINMIDQIFLSYCINY